MPLSVSPPASSQDAVSTPADARLRHRPHENLQALLAGTLLVALGLTLFGQAQLVSGGTAGLALLLHYHAKVDVGVAFFLCNLPFYVFAWLRLGARVALRTVAAVGVLSAMVHLLPRGLAFAHVDPVLASVAGGLLCGTGMLALFRHGATLGGFNLVAMWLQERWGVSAGKVQMALDAAVVLGGALTLGDARRLWLSVLAVVVLNLTLVFNHRPGRYRGL